MSTTICAVPAPTAGPASRCGPGSVTLTASGAGAGEDYRWYDAASGGGLLQMGGATFATPSISATTTYYASAYNTATACESARTAVMATVNTIPDMPAPSNDGPICAGGTLHLSTPTVAGATYSWTGPNGFSSATQNPSIAGVTTAAGGAYSVTVTVGSCASAAGSTSATVNADNTAPTVTSPAPITVDQTVCCGTFGGVTSAGSAALATFLGGGSATDDCVTSPTRLTPQVSATDVTASTCFEVGATTVTFRFQDLAGHVGTATSTATVRMYGDLDLGGGVDPTDMVVLRAYFNFVATPGTPPFNAPLDIADVNHDAVVDPTDSVILRGYLNLLVTCLAP